MITVCDDARESCPVFPGGAETLHWGFPDPAAATGTDAEISVVYRRTFAGLAERIGMFIPLARRERDEAEIATAPGASF